MLTATLTRPTTISPVTSRSTKVKFQDSIDIESMHTPKSRVITLEPISKRGKVKLVKPGSSVTTQTTNSGGAMIGTGTSSGSGSGTGTGTGTGTGAGRLTRNNTQNSTTSRSIHSIVNPPLSPSPSEDTVQTNNTANTTSTQSFQMVEVESPAQKGNSPQNSDSRSNATSSSAHTITATSELPRHGALPGDTVPIRVSITHSKADVRGVVIATLYRQGRVDMHPPLPLPTKGGKEKKHEYEDVYPKSRTGLGGLYFATASPNSVFRKDLAQSSTMMIVNPATMTADITTSIKVPENAFPTIANVPGGMISFTYHVEVVVDLFGKLGETRLWPRLTSSEPTFSHSTTTGNQISSDWANNILDTAPLRRTKSVVTFEMSLVVGTLDSGRKRRQAKQAEAQPIDGTSQWGEEGWHDQQYYQHYGYDDQYYDEMGYPTYDGYPYQYDYDANYSADVPTSATETIPPPEPYDSVDEKTRLRRQEELLLPSEPPQEGESSSSAQPYAATAPEIPSNPSNQGIHNPNDGSATPSTLHPASSVASAQSADTIRPYTASPPPAHFAGEGVQATDDKQELERRRLLAQTSAPPLDNNSQSSSSTVTPPPPPPPPLLAPSAPTINEQDEYNVQTLNHDHIGLDLPQYER